MANVIKKKSLSMSTSLTKSALTPSQVHIDPQLELLGCVPYRPGRLPLANISGV